MPHLKFMVAGTLILGAICYLMFSGINDSMVYYYTVSELMNKAEEIPGKGVRVSGYVSPGTIRGESTQSKVEFVMFEKESDRTLPVVYQGIIPDTFKDNAEVVVEGTYRPEEEVFEATVLLAKCPSKYETLATEHPQDIPIKKEIE
ncbi:cytochrome c maturation protein CcmE [Acidobacteria bacterium AH-259-O06]|nr:cytochrome c maturation protein CcmE [Acidobacteria bacterium AH-259-O06]